MKGRQRLVSDTFEVPEFLVTENFKLRMLTVNDLIKDYDAVMSSVAHLQSTYSVISGSDWPAGLTLEEDLIDLGWHQREFSLRYSFAYTVISLDESLCLGCVYIDPCQKTGYDVEISMWVRKSEADNLDSRLYYCVKKWINDVWPFSKPAYPGREVTIEDWKQLP
tara:strand:+ start:908 stop:1402 length:495 start_codon:yes stop_codon:yes gene_type:complete